DIGGRSLADILKSMKLHRSEFLCLAVRIAEIIGNIHKRNIIHKDINPSNIIWNIEKDIVRIIDFGIATELPREITSVKNPNVLEGTLEYISPEQTGRMNRSLDYRTDFYSLGITFYWMLTGCLPFESKDLLKLMHSHIAVLPVSPHEIDKSIPGAVSEIVIKLMAKNAEDRYLSAYGLQADLERCLQELRDTGSISTFELGLHDVSDKFQIPQKLYGREQETRTLMSVFERVREGNRELMLVSGLSGIGKSALINEIQRPVVKHSGYFISGKFERLKKSVPYSAIIQAFTGFARQILAEGDTKISLWRKKILSVLGPNGKIISDIIPLFELIIGKQPDIPTLGPVESRNRFKLVLQAFMKILASKENPLVVFLDDLQWADLASLQLLKLFANDSYTKHLFVIGAWRHNETPDSHPLILTLDEIKKTDTIVNDIFLQPLGIDHVSRMLGDTLNLPEEETKSPAELLIRKTSGNPFFIKEFLKSLYKEKLIEFSFEHGWSWHTTEIEEMQATDNVVDLMTEKIADLPESSQEVLKLGACIGSSFNITNMLMVCNKPRGDILAALNEVLQEGMLNRIDNIYQFSHDRVLEAVYSLIPDEEKTRQH
ncbi:MAG: serine/threonine-protein kinase PknK, partial [bacterium]|nr:serine/threonine-protein kinase PknK [bacterium]